MALVFQPLYAGDTGEAYQSGTNTAVRNFVVGRDDGSGGIDESGALFTAAEFVSMDGENLAKAQASLWSGTSFDRVSIQQRSPYALTVSVYQSNSGFYDLATQSEPDAPGTVYNFQTRDQQFTIPFVVETEKGVPNSDSRVTVFEERSLTDTTPITTVDVEITIEQWRLPVEVRTVNQQVNYLHIINGIPYRFKGASSVRSIGTPDEPLYRVRYQWEYDIGSLAGGLQADGEPSLSGPSTFTSPTVGLLTYPGVWWRPPYCGITIGTVQDGFITTPFGPVPKIVPASAYAVLAVTGQELSWQNLPGTPIQ